MVPHTHFYPTYFTATALIKKIAAYFKSYLFIACIFITCANHSICPAAPDDESALQQQKNEALKKALKSINQTDYTESFHCLSLHHLRIALACINDGANPNIGDSADGSTALHYAAQLRAPDIIQQLLAKNAHVNAQTNRYKLTPLDFSMEGHYGSVSTKCIQLLLDAGADTTIEPLICHSVLMQALYNEHQVLLNLFIDAGAPLASPIKTIQKGIDYLRSCRHKKITLEILNQALAQNNSLLHCAAVQGFGFSNMRYLLAQEAIRAAIEAISVTPLPEHAQTPRINYILNENPSLDVANAEGNTARQYMQLRVWLTERTRIIMCSSAGTKLELDSARGARIHHLKDLVAAALNTQDCATTAEQIRLIRNDNKVEAQDLELVGTTEAFSLMISSHADHGGQAGPAE